MHGGYFRFDAETNCLMEMCDEEQTVALVELIDDGEASMHALAGTYNPRTLRIQGIINGKEPTLCWAVNGWRN